MAVRYNFQRPWLVGAIGVALMIATAIFNETAVAEDGPPTVLAMATTRPAAPASEPAHSDLITNLWVDTDIRQVVQDISSQSNTIILCDQPVQGIVSMSVKDMPL